MSSDNEYNSKVESKKEKKHSPKSKKKLTYRTQKEEKAGVFK